jgi:hypothetical protein
MMRINTKKFKRTILFSLLAGACGSASAVSPISIGDPGITDTLFTGTVAYQGGKLGTSIASGDFNGDGVADLVMGAPGMQSPRGTGQEGLVFVYFGGSSTGVGVLPAQVSTQDGKQDALYYGVKGYISQTDPGERAGEMLAVGDVNGDNRDDLIIVAQNGHKDHHKIYIVFGAKTLSGGSLANADVVITRVRGAHVPSTWATFRVSAITTGDLNGDGYDDIVLSDRLNNRFEVLLGKATAKWPSTLDLAKDSDITYVHSKSGDSFADLVSEDYFPLQLGGDGAVAGVAVGDFNGDGNNDLVMGLPNETAAVKESGRMYLILGATGKFDPQPAPVEIDKITGVVLIDGALAGDKAGGPLALGNINGDKNATRDVDDLIIGEPVSQHGIVNSSGFGKAQVLLGRISVPAKIDLFDDAATLTLRIKRKVDEGGLADKGFYTGTAVLANDINGDGLGDITITSPGATFDSADGHKQGWVQTVYGSPAFTSKKEFFLTTDADLWTTTPVPTDPLASGYTGASITSGDFDNDGKPDMAMGAPLGSAFGTVTSGYVPLLLGVADKGGCNGTDVIVEGSFAASATPYSCEGSNSLITSGDVVVENGATVGFYSPSITLNGGFRVVTGGIFRANKQKDG